MNTYLVDVTDWDSSVQNRSLTAIAKVLTIPLRLVRAIEEENIRCR